VHRAALRALGLGAALALLPACYALRPSAGGGRADFDPPRAVRAADVALPDGYTIVPVATGLTFPTGVAFDAKGRPHVVEAGYSYGEVFVTPRLLRVQPDGTTALVASGDNGPWTGVAFHGGAFYVAEGGVEAGGRILRIRRDGRTEKIVTGLPTLGDHHTNGPAIGQDGWVYFGLGTATNAGIVGPDNAEFGWLRRRPDFHDVPCRDVTLAGVNVESDDPLHDGEKAVTGAFVPFGTPTSAGQMVKGQIPCSGAVMRVPAAGGPLELVAWGFRNPFGLAFAPDGRLFVADNGYDVRGSRPVFGAPDLLWAVERGRWYGWPDHAGGESLASGRFDAPGKPPLKPLLASPPTPVPQPVARLAVNSSSNGLDFARNPGFGYAGHAFVAQFGDMTPGTGKVMGPVGFKVVRIDPSTGVVEDFAVNRGRVNGPASRLGSGGLERPVAVRFDAEGTSLYVVDFGVMTMTKAGPRPREGTGVLWRIRREGP
jgi:glucose/arabinose dehydrogenase